MQIFSKTDTGLKRASNQDCVYTGFLPDNSAFVIVCDGMGGANAGNIASQTAVQVISEYVYKSYQSKMNRQSLQNLIKNAIVDANIIIYNMSKENKDYEGMGTTAVVLVVRNGFAVICHAGDSRAYLISDGISQITKDHSVVQSLLEDGKLTAAEAKHHPIKNVITRALGVEKNLIPDCMQIPIEISNTVLVCTDGLTNFVDEKEILRIIKENNAEEVPDILIDTANKNGGGDNITAVTVTV